MNSIIEFIKCLNWEVIKLLFIKPKRKLIDRDLLCLNAFFNQLFPGSIDYQYRNITQDLNIKRLRVFVHTGNETFPARSSNNLSHIQSVVNSAPEGVELLIVVSGAPDWIEGTWNPYTVWANEIFGPIVEAFKNESKVIGYEVWNEPDAYGGVKLQLQDPKQYAKLLKKCYGISKAVNPNKLILNAATTSIQLNYPEKLNYNKTLVELDVLSTVDVWNVHYYGEQFEKLVNRCGVAKFLDSIDKPIWITESGAQGFNSQLAYVEKVWPFLKKKIKRLERIYFYIHSDELDKDSTFGLVNSDPNFSTSDLYNKIVKK